MDPMLPEDRTFATALMLRVNGNLNFTLDQEMLEKLSELPLMAPLTMNLQQLISKTSNVSGEEKFQQHMKKGVPNEAKR